MLKVKKNADVICYMLTYNFFVSLLERNVNISKKLTKKVNAEEENLYNIEEGKTFERNFLKFSRKI